MEQALLMVAQFGWGVIRRSYGNPSIPANKWYEVLLGQAFTPSLQYQYVRDSLINAAG
ncbi:hypothetical protein [Xanthomonas sp. 4461]|uniref:hypothetical protein n=1 Tax=Xanthomonas sp. 4461 TaxID=3035313 RepID=UPI00216A064E|nr:hypothetical protein [Xanthomonas sp. 4461]MCS3807180.1 hypothetical protein [Xanthomonas sp. 4461]